MYSGVPVAGDGIKWNTGGYWEVGSFSNHASLTNLAWSVAGHTINTNIDMNNFNLQEVKEIQFGNAACYIKRTVDDMVFKDPNNLEQKLSDLISGGGAATIHEELIPPFATYTLSNNFVSGSLVVFKNGLAQVPSNITEIPPNQFSFVAGNPIVTDTVSCTYTPV